MLVHAAQPPQTPWWTSCIGDFWFLFLSPRPFLLSSNVIILITIKLKIKFKLKKKKRNEMCC